MASPCALLAAALLAAWSPAQGDCGRVASFADGKAPTTVVHVAGSGSDADGDGSASRPYATIARGARGVRPGTAVRIHAGTYAGGAFLEKLRGTTESPIWLGGAPGESKPVLEGGAEALHLSKPFCVVVHDLEVRNTTSNGINADDGGDFGNAEAGRHVAFSNLVIHDVGKNGNEDGLKLSGVNDFVVLDCQFARCGGRGSGSGIDLVGCHRGTIARSAFEQMSANAVQVKGGSEDVEIRACRMKDAGARAVNLGGSTGTAYFRPPLSTRVPNYEAKDVRVVANLIIGSEAPVAFVESVDCLVANNTIVDPGRWVLRILQETTTSGEHVFTAAARGRFVNNLVWFERGKLKAFANVGPGVDAGSFEFRNNLWYAHDDPPRSAPSDLPGVHGGSIAGRDPAPKDPAAGDFSIGRSSPAAGAGIPARVRGDLEGACFGAPPSIGAFEARR